MDKKLKVKLKAIKIRADAIKIDPALRHTPNQNDIAKCSENTHLMQVYQEETLKYKGRERYD